MTGLSRREILKAGIATSAACATSLPFPSLLRAVQSTPSLYGMHSGQRTLDLSGTWRLKRDDAKEGLTQRWFAGKLPSNNSGPASAALPGSMDEAGAGSANPDAPSLDGLYRPNVYAGPAWYQREIEVPFDWKGKSVSLFLERTHWVTRAWLDGRELGIQESLIAPHVYDLGTQLSSGTHVLTICVDNTIRFDLGRFVSIYYEGTQTNWNGIIGKIELRAKDLISIANMQVFPDLDRKVAKVRISIRNLSGAHAAGDLRFFVIADSEETASGGMLPFSISGTEATVETNISMGPNPKLWDEFSPNLYSMRVMLSTHGHTSYKDEGQVLFGMRSLTVKGKQFVMNGRPLRLRGTLECAIFPLTGYPPTNIDAWRRIYQIEKSYGFNFIRFHSWTPPEAAFIAADIEGVIIQTEGPQANVPTGVVDARDQFVERELLRIVQTYGNHPSFALMTIGNEYGGSEQVINRWVDLLIKSDDRHLYSSASSNPLKAVHRQFTEDHQMRGVHGPGTEFDYAELMDKEDRPYIGHEIGQWTFFPDLDEIRKYTGVLRAKNFELIRDDLAKKGMLDQARLFLEATGKHAILLYKDEIETISRTRGYAGFSLLDLHDYPGQGTALIGLLDPFWNSKGLIQPVEHRGYAGSIVPLLRFKKRTFRNNEAFEASAELANFGPVDLHSAEVSWSITDQSGAVIASGELPPVAAVTGDLTKLGKFTASLAVAVAPVKLRVNLSVRNTSFANSWDIWVYPSDVSGQVSTELTIGNVWGSEIKKALSQGRTALLFPASLPPENVLKGSFTPVFWSPIWFQRDPSTMGILVNPDHPLFSKFPTDLHSNWQWHSLIENSHTVILNDTPITYRPLVQVIDNFARNNRLGTVFEARVGTGKLLVCTLNLNQQNLKQQTPEQQQFLYSLYAYASSETFAPLQELSWNTLDRILLKREARPASKE
jgi:hypothetical protein